LQKQKIERVSANNMTEDKDGLERAASQPNISEISEDEIDRDLMGTFPASGPPSWTLDVERDKQSGRESQIE
jgi:hypothetical protein